MSRMGQDDEKARIGGQRECGNGVCNLSAKMVRPQGLEPWTC